MKAVKSIIAILAATVLCLTLNSCGSYEFTFPADGGYYTGGYYGPYCPPPPPPPPPPPHHHHR